MAKTHLTIILIITLFFPVPGETTIATGKIIYVDDDAPGANDGTSWENAYTLLQDALAAAYAGDEIRVAKGIYTPYQGYVLDPNDDILGIREATFLLVDEVTIRGGFAGIGQIDPDARDIEAYKTILSGDLNRDDIDVNDPADLENEPTRAENSYHVVVCDVDAVLDGLTITGGNANGTGGRHGDMHNFGGGIYNKDGSPTVINCTFVNNYAALFGGGIVNYNGNLNITKCEFTRNLSGEDGAAIYNHRGDPNLTNCTFKGNSAIGEGGGLANYQGNPTLTNCIFTENSAPIGFPGGEGGGMWNYEGSSVLTNCTFTRNYSSREGGGIKNYYSVLVLNNCSFNDNSAIHDEIGRGRGGGLHNYGSDSIINNCIFKGNLSEEGGGIHNCHNSHPVITNCIFTENTSEEGGGIYNEESNPDLANCTFIENSARAGGGLYNKYSNPTLVNCVFRGNSVPDQGGGMCNILKRTSRNRPILINCLFTGNHSGFRGGGIYNLSCEPVMTHCTFAGNWAGEGNALYCKSEQEQNTIKLTNCILWDFGTEIWNDDLSKINISYSNIQGGWDGVGNIDIDPLFADQFGPDRIPGTEDDDLRLSPLSPCIDAGDPGQIPEPNETDLAGNPRLRFEYVDMGAYEFQGLIYVDDDAPKDPGPGDTLLSDPLENGTEPHPMDSIQEAIDIARDEYTILVRPGLYDKIDFKGKAITVTSTEGAAMIWAPSLWNAEDYDAVTFHTGEGRGSVLKNFVIRDSSTAISLNFSSPKIHNVTIINNDFGIAAYEDSNPDIRNCILWNNTNGDLFQCEATHSCIERPSPGEGNINVNPLFVDAANGDYHLKSQGWRWNTASQSWTWDDVTSRCIDGGDPCSPLGDEPMSVPRDPDNLYGMNRYINMGAFGGTCQASMPPLDWPPLGEDRTPPTPNPAQWAPGGAPQEVYGGGGTFDYWVEMKAEPATDTSGLVEYFFECTTLSGFSSGWICSPTYSIQVGQSGQGHSFRLKARDTYGNETAWSEELTAN